MAVEGIRPYTIGCLFCYTIAIVSTFLRLGHRYQMKQLGWDDFWAIVTLLAAIILVAVLLATVLLDLQSFIHWVVYPLNTTAIWGSRMSIGTTILRILPNGRRRQITLAGNTTFAILWFVIIIQKIFVCGIPVPRLPFCGFTLSTPVIGISLNFIASMWLVFWPAYILLSHRCKMASLTQGTGTHAGHHGLLIACFSTSILCMSADIGHIAFFITNDHHRLRITGHIEVALALLFCNTLILATSFYRWANSGPVNNQPYSNTGNNGARGIPLPNFGVGGNKRHTIAVTNPRLSLSPTQLAIRRHTQPFTVFRAPDVNMPAKPPSGSNDNLKSEQRLDSSILEVV